MDPFDTQEFLRLIQPNEGQRFCNYGATKPETQYYTGDLKKLAKFIADKAKEKLEVWFAPATFKSRRRKAEDALHVRSAWMDWDVDPVKAAAGGPAYATYGEAKAAAMEFYRRLGITKGIVVVKSGGGLHTYVVFTDNVEPEAWKITADMVKALGIEWGFKFDRTRAADIASIMRPIGTNNHKLEEPRPVKLLNITPIEPLEWQWYCDHIQHLFDTATFTSAAPAAPGNPFANKKAAAMVRELMPESLRTLQVYSGDYPPASYDRMIDNCQQMRYCADNQDRISEPLWWAAISNAGRSTDKLEAVHWISAKHPGYKAEDAEEKFQRTTGPMTCRVFYEQRPNGCDGCPQFAGIATGKSPISYASKYEAGKDIEVELPQVTGTVASEALKEGKPQRFIEKIPALDFLNFKYTNNKLIVTLTKDVTMQDGTKRKKEYDKVLINHPFYPLNINKDDRDQSAVEFGSMWMAEPPGSAPVRINIKGGDINSAERMSQILGTGMMYMPKGKDDLFQVMQGMKYWIDQIRKEHTVLLPAHMGWTNTEGEAQTADDSPLADDGVGFVIGNRLLTKNGIREVHTAAHSFKDMSLFKPRGSLDKWLEVYQMYNTPGAEKLALATLFGAAAPLAKMLSIPSIMIALTGKTGGGKTFLQMFNSSFWGHPELLVHAPTGSVVEQTKFIYDLNNLPAMFDDFHSLPDPELIARTFEFANGYSKPGLRQDGSVNKNRGGHFRAVIMLSTNKNLHEAIENHYQGDKAAARYRILQHFIPQFQWPTTPGNSGAELRQKLSENYGLAGPIWADYLLNNIPLVRKQLARTAEFIRQNWGANQQARYFVEGCAAVMVTYMSLRKLGLCPLDPGMVERELHLLYSTSFNEAQAQVLSGGKTLAEYVNAMQSRILITAGDLLDEQSATLLNGDIKHEIVGRNTRPRPPNEGAGELWLLSAPLKKYLAEKRIPWSGFIEALVKEELLMTEGETTVALGRGLKAVTLVRARGLKVFLEKLQ